MEFEFRRLKTFSQYGWSSSIPVEVEKLAKAGFYFCGNGDEVVCFSCNGRVSGWNINDQAFLIHKQKYPNCPFVLNPIDSGNIPLTQLGAPASVSQFRHSSGSSQSYHSANSANFSQYSERLSSFIDWPHAFLTPSALAKAGFYYLGSEDIATCAFCFGSLKNWMPGDDPLTEHIAGFPDCPFAQSLRANARTDDSVENERSRGDEDELLYHNKMEELGILASEPAYFEMATYDARLNSFVGWPEQQTQRPPDLAEAGFYYLVVHTPASSGAEVPLRSWYSLGSGDSVKCFHCGGGLRHWNPSDQPWGEHAHWYPKCEYLRSNKSQSFICKFNGAEASTQYSSACPISDICSPIKSPFLEHQFRKLESLRAHGMRVDLPHVTQAIEMGYPEELVCAAIQDNPQECYSSSLGKFIDKLENIQSTSSTSLLETSDKSSRKGLTCEEENRRLKEQRLCKICMDVEVSIVFLPCGHQISCARCAPALKTCPVCRLEIKARVRTFLS